MNKALLAIILTTTLLAHSLQAEELVEDFEKAELGEIGDQFMVIDGEFEVIQQEDNKVLKLPSDPLIECGLLFAKSTRSATTVEGRVYAEKRGRRSFPRFALGAHGVSGYKIRVVPAQKRVELVFQDEVIANAPFTWKSGEWCSLRLELSKDGDTPKLQAWAWMNNNGDTKAPKDPILTHTGEAGTRSQGKPSVWGTPYSGKDILFDDLKATWTPTPKKNN